MDDSFRKEPDVSTRPIKCMLPFFLLTFQFRNILSEIESDDHHMLPDSRTVLLLNALKSTAPDILVSVSPLFSLYCIKPLTRWLEYDGKKYGIQ